METLKTKFPVLTIIPYGITLLTLALGTFAFGVLFFTFSLFMPSTSMAYASTPKWTPASTRPILEVHIANNGMALLRGARIEAIVGSTLTVSTTWNNAKMLWAVHTDESYYGKRHFGTSFFNSKGELLGITDFKVGDTIMVSGTFDVDAAAPTIKAEVIR